jgi:hypothetical protein
VFVEPVEAFGPESAVGFEPLVHADQGAGVDAAYAMLPVALSRDEGGLFEYAEVTGDSRRGDVERLDKLPHGCLTEHKTREDSAARRVRQGRERAVEVRHNTQVN